MKIADELDPRDVMQAVASERPVFHSEADFQFSFAWTVKSLSEQLKVRLEVPILRPDRLDIQVIGSSGSSTAIELKYLTRKQKLTVNGEDFQLAEQRAHNHRRYAVIKDISRVEQFVASERVSNGLVIALTNDSRFWDPAPNSRASDLQFRFDESAVLSLERDWEREPASNARGKITLRGIYPARWNDFGTHEAVRLRYAMFEVESREFDGRGN